MEKNTVKYVVEFNEDATGKVESAYFSTKEEAIAFASEHQPAEIYGPASEEE